MAMSDPLADMLTRIRNGSRAHFERVDMPLSKMRVSVAKVLADEGFIQGYEVKEAPFPGVLEITLKYGPDGENVISGIKRVSKPGLRQYVKSKDASKVLNGFGIAILSTSQGLMTDRAARRQNVGGEIICEVW